jgi:hypothetical protein
MLQRLSIAIGAGCAAALLFAVSAEPNLFAMALAYLAPLPIMIATLGWGLDSGAIAGGVAAASLAAVADPLSGLYFALTIVLPAWLLAAYAIIPVSAYWRKDPSVRPVYASPGAVVLAAALFGILASAGAVAAMMIAHGGYDAGVREVASGLERAISDAFDAAAPDGMTLTEFTDIIVRAAPPAVAGSVLVILCVNLYAAARSAQLSQRLARPWQDLPRALIIPWPAAIALIVTTIGAYLLPSPASQFAWIGVGGLGGAFALQGLSVAHELSRGLPLRPLMLIALYLCCLLRAKWTIPVVAALGVIEGFAKLRARAARRFPEMRT